MRKPILLPLGKGMCTLWWLSLCFLSFQLVAQPCPTIINCPQSTPTYCDESTNDPFLWNDAPYTVSNTIGGFDMHEGAIDLNLKVKGCNGGGITSISYILYLDLDDDGIQETVVMSGNPPPAGRVQANNIFNPGYSGGDTVHIDRRILPDSMLYRFSIEIVYSGDTTTGWVRFNTDAQPYTFTPVQLPEGRHRIEWRTVQDGVERFCDRNFKVKDCKKPTVACKAGLAVYLDVTQTAQLTLNQALQSVSDNITPDSQLVLGMRRLGTGFGFPLDAMGNPQDTAMFSCQSSENQLIEIWAKDKSGNIENCTAPVLVYDTTGVCPFIANPSICVRNFWNNEIVRGTKIKMSWNTQNQGAKENIMPQDFSGCADLSTLPPASVFKLSVEKDTFPLNGVTTYDLVLISKHILAIETFDAGWKLAAADVNLSNSVTTFDIVELRKLILGLNAKLPNGVPSWRFFVDTCSVWGSPFFGYCPLTYTLPVQPISYYPQHLSFSGVKMGDVNGTAANVDTLQGTAQTRGEAILLEMPELDLKAGETKEITISATESGSWEGFQFALKYDPEKLEIEAVQSGDAMPLESENWASPTPGALSFSWSDAYAKPVLSGDAWLKLRVKAHSDLRLSDAIQGSKDGAMLPEAYDENGINHPLSWRFSNKASLPETSQAQVFEPMPNPTTGVSRIPLRLIADEKVSVEVNDLNGNLLWRQEAQLSSGAHFLEIPAAVTTASGIYIWRVCAGATIKSGRLIRI